ncbi:MAG TPA: alpha/beta hydrolase [Opitutus sp.]|nr:alpha/beta hydrolase [Opitutus sp.]
MKCFRHVAPLLVLGFALEGSSLLAGVSAPIRLWPDKPRGGAAATAPEADTTKPGDNLIAGRPLIRLGNVSEPTITIYSPDAAKNTGAAAVVCPGGGYYILAMDLEGTEVCAWLNSIGVTGILLKYRVPAPRESSVGEQVAAGTFPPLQDAQRALGLVRSRAKEFGVDPQRIGVLGFSAGGHLSAALSNHYEKRDYAAIDAADQVSCRPDFCVLIYPGYLVREPDLTKVGAELAVAKEKTPPTFLAMAEDDPVHVENVIHYYLALKNAGVPAELHTYPTGGHGYGLRRTKDLVTTWPDRVADWMRAGGWLK